MTEFRRSSLCGNPNYSPCAEVKIDSDAVTIRNSTSPERQVSFTRDEWRTLVAGIKKDEFNA